MIKKIFIILFFPVLLFGLYAAYYRWQQVRDERMAKLVRRHGIEAGAVYLCALPATFVAWLRWTQYDRGVNVKIIGLSERGHRRGRARALRG